MSFEKYLRVVSGSFKEAIKVEWLNPDESVSFEFTNSLYDINVDLSVNYQNGSRRTCTLTLNNDRNRFPINFNNIWIGQKFKLWMGVYIDEKTPYYFPQGVFYVSNPNEVYQPSTKTMKINGVDKWAYLDGTLHGKLSGTYQTSIGTNLYDATRKLLQLPKSGSMVELCFKITNGEEYYFAYNGAEFTSNNYHVNGSTATTTLTALHDIKISFDYSYSSQENYDKFTLIVAGKTIEDNVSGYTNVKNFSGRLLKGETIFLQYTKNQSTHNYDDRCAMFNINIEPTSHLYIGDVVDPVPPLISPYFLNKPNYVLNMSPSYDSNQKYYTYENGTYSEYSYSSSANWKADYISLYVLSDVWKCPYTAKVERGKTYADILLEYATILCANIYYDVNGRLVIEPMIDTTDDITDTNKEVVWHYTVDEKTFLGLTQTYNFDKVYNDIIVLGNIANGYQFKARVQNRNIMSDTCVQKIGLKTKEPIEDNQYYSDEQCKELAMYYAKVDTILQKSGDINSTPLYHLDVNKLVSVSTPNNNMSKELFLITGFTMNSSGDMSINVTSVNILKDFSVVEAGLYE